MYRKFFGIKKPPFSIAPDPRCLYMSEQHREALAHLLYGIKNDSGFVLLTGEVGTGKTTVCRRLLEVLTKKCAVAFILNPTLSAPELLAAICDEFQVSYPKRSSLKHLVDLINAHLLRLHSERKKAILIIDEAQNLRDEVLEQIRLLTNLETNDRKLLQIIMIGQPELRDKLAKPHLRQLSQRIVARYHLGPLSRDDLRAYIRHRLSISGANQELFPDKVLKFLHSRSGGIPRVVNAICDRALLGAFVQGRKTIDIHTVSRAAEEVLGTGATAAGLLRRAAPLAAGIILFIGTGMYFYFSGVPEFIGSIYQRQDTPILRPLPASQQKLEAPGATAETRDGDPAIPAPVAQEPQDKDQGARSKEQDSAGANVETRGNETLKGEPNEPKS